VAKEDALGALREFGRELTAKFRQLGDAQPEDQLKTPVDRLVTELGKLQGQSVVVNTESRVEDIGRPDIAISTRGLLCGYIELKAPGVGAEVRRLTGRNRDQWNKFKALPNLIYTDGNDWVLYRDGAAAERASLTGSVTEDGGAAITGADAEAMVRLLRDFFSWQPIVPTNPRRLAELLAPLCKLIRSDVLEALPVEGSAMASLKAEWRSYLFPEADDEQFADAYAQTLTYALLLARLSGAKLTQPQAADRTLRQRHRLLGEVLSILTQPRAREEIALGIDLLERTIEAVDPAALGSTHDPWLYFYEDFLAAYDPRLRNERGVYYTPVEVVKAQVALVGDLLTTKLGKPLGFADEGVVVLDPATGTGTYPLAAMQAGLDAVEAAYGPGERAGAATRMAENIHAFELLVGPYAVAHLRLSEQVEQAGGQLPADGAHVYLTDTLESPNASPPGQFTLQSTALVDEHQRALRVKGAETPVLVCIGNPPYDREQREIDEVGPRRGGWIRFGEAGAPIGEAPLEDFLRPVREAGAGGHLKNVYNDYVYFWRWALWKVFETKTGPGIVSFITASSYLRGPGFAGMREQMRRTFDELWIVDLEGGSLGARSTENVFAIRTPVAIAVGIRYGDGDSESPTETHYAKIEGPRAAKLAALRDLSSFQDLRWSECYSGWLKPLVPIGVGDFFAWPALTDLFPWQHTGAEIKRSWPIGESPELVRKRWAVFLRSSDRRISFNETRDLKVDRQYPALEDARLRLSSLASLPSNSPAPEVSPYSFRTLDRQHLLLDPRLGDYLRPSLWLAHGHEQVFMSSMLTDVLGAGPAAMVTSSVPDRHHFSGRGGKDVMPLWRNAEATEPNVTLGLIELLRAIFGSVVSPEDLFAYAYAVLGGTSYTERFADELSIPGPRLPLTKDGDVFRRGVGLGRRLIALHTYGERFGDALPGGRLGGTAKSRIGVAQTADGYPERFEYNDATHELHVGEGRFGPVEPTVWAYEVSGLRVVRSWLGYRMKERAGRSSSPLDDIRPERWTQEMSRELLELLWVLEATVAMEPELQAFLDAVVAGPLFTADELPTPTDEERAAPARRRGGGEVEQPRLMG